MDLGSLKDNFEGVGSPRSMKQGMPQKMRRKEALKRHISSQRNSKLASDLELASSSRVININFEMDSQHSVTYKNQRSKQHSQKPVVTFKPPISSPRSAQNNILHALKNKLKQKSRFKPQQDSKNPVVISLNCSKALTSADYKELSHIIENHRSQITENEASVVEAQKSESET